MKRSLMLGKIVLVTGANSGVGKATALALASQGATMILACRNLAKGEDAAEEIRSSSGNDAVRVVHLDLSDVRSVEQCVQEVIAQTPRLDVLINNAGGIQPKRAITPQGVEQTFAANYLNHYALTRLLLSHLLKATNPRVINVSSDGHRFINGINFDDLNLEQHWGVMKAYAQSKLAQILFTRELARRYVDAGLIAHAVHPGFVHSNFYAGVGQGLVGGSIKIFVRLFAISSTQGAATSIYVAAAPQALQCNGQYWAKCKLQRSSRATEDDQAALRLWQRSEELLTGAGFLKEED